MAGFSKDGILRNVEQILKEKNIDLMNKSTYQFIELHCGTIAHFDINGWCREYEDLRDFINLFLVKDEYGRNLQEEIRTPRWQEDDLKPYVEIVQGIIDLCKRYRDEVFEYFDAKEKALTEELIAKLQSGVFRLRDFDIRVR